MAEAKPPCRVGATAEDLAREADRAVLYGACLKILRPETRIKPELGEAVAALLPSVRALFDGRSDALAQFASDYAAACGATAFLHSKLHEYRRRQTES
jgi:hypothetical protein